MANIEKHPIEATLESCGIHPPHPPLSHQAEGLFKSWGKHAFAQLGDMGTGKTWMLITEAAALYNLGHIDGVLVLAPKGVDFNWLKDQLPQHLQEDIKSHSRMALWRAGAKKAQRKAIEELFTPTEEGRLRSMLWLMMNWDALNTKQGFACAERFLEHCEGRTLIICDEAHRAKDPSRQRTKALMKLKPLSSYRRIASGSIVLNSPFDLFAPFNFLDWRILGTRSYYAFKAEYAQLLKPGHPLYDAILRKNAGKQIAAETARARAQLRRANPTASESWVEAEAEKRAKARAYEVVSRRMPQLVAKDKGGAPLYRNLERLRTLIEPHSFRVLKEECLDLPEKVYTQTYFELTPAQRKVYNELKNKARLLIDDETIEPLIKITAIAKMSQVTSNFYIESATKEVHRIPGKNPKLELLEDRLSGLEGHQAIIWAVRHVELEDIMRLCRKLGLSAVEYSGRVDDEAVSKAIPAFQHGSAQVFVGQQRKGGTGTTLTAASRVFYYSNSFSLEDRVQSEDRAHRIGQNKAVVYEDLIAEGTVEEEIIRVLQRKGSLASIINGDDLRKALA